MSQTGRVASYMAKFQELKGKLSTVSDEEAFSVCVSGLKPHLREQVGAHAKGNLEEAITTAQRIEIY